MISVGIKKEHIIKLEKMLNDLYGEYSIKYFDYQNNTIVLLSKEGRKSIGWYEFCVTDLFSRIFGEDKTKAFLDNLNEYFFSLWDYIHDNSNPHPVDYIYSMYKNKTK